MTTHELANKLLKGPNVTVTFRDEMVHPIVVIKIAHEKNAVHDVEAKNGIGFDIACGEIVVLSAEQE